MAPGDFSDLQLSLARLSGLNAFASLAPGDQALASQCINEVYTEIFIPPDTNARPRFARKTLGFQYRAPVVVTLGLTQGSTVFTGYTPPAGSEGSKIQLGDKFYGYAGQASDLTYNLVEPYNEPSGTYTGTFYHSSYSFDASIIELLEAPEVIGWGPLSPMSGRETDILYRSNYFDGFRPLPGYGYQRATSQVFGGQTYDTGQPLFYFINGETYIDTAPMVIRMEVRPLPNQITTGNVSVFRAPPLLVNATDHPLLPADLCNRILLPMLRGRWVMTYKKYSGENKKEIIALAEIAKAQLRSLSNNQRRRPVTCQTAHT
jgi:hypothetical protein